MFFAQLASREGLRGIEITLRAHQHSFYHMGFRCATVSRNTLANANEVRPWQIWAELAQELMKLICDQLIRLTGAKTRKGYPEHLRRIKCDDPETGRSLVFLTNDFDKY